MQYSFKIQIIKREDETAEIQEELVINSPRWYDALFRTAIAVIWAMEELKEKMRGKE